MKFIKAKVIPDWRPFPFGSKGILASGFVSVVEDFLSKNCNIIMKPWINLIITVTFK